MALYYCPFCRFPCRSKKGLTQHIQQKAACLRAQKESLGLTSTPPPKKAKLPPAPAAASLAKAKSVSFQPFNDQVEFISPRTNNKKRDFAELEQLSPEEVEAVRNVRGLVEEDALARAQLFGQLDDDTLHKEHDVEDNRKMPAREHNLDTSSEEDDEPTQVWQDPDDYFAAEEAEHLARTTQEVLDFMDNDNVPLQPTLAHAQQQQVQQQVLAGLLDDDWNNDRIINANPNTKMRDDFRAYCAEAEKHYMGSLTKSQQKGVKLLNTLKQKKAPLDTYGAVMDWHYRDKGAIKEHESLADVGGYISREVLMDTIKHRYNMADKFPESVALKLPVSNAQVNLTTHSAWDCISSLLTDPRVEDDDYNFVDNDPFAPPAKGATIGDFHTARAHREAYDKYITDPTKQVLMPFQFYIDGACTGQFQNLPITALKMALGIHTRKYRQNEWAWRTLGYVAQVSKPNSRGKGIFTESGHMDAEVEDIMEGEGQQSSTSKLNIAQDFHAMLEVILQSYLEVQENGFVWDLRYRGKTYKDVEFVPYVVFVKCDTDEADLLCGSFKTRTGNVKNLCRYCTCPTNESDLVNAKFPFKTVSMIKPSIVIQDEEGLRAISQQLIDNAWYKIRFSPESSRGIHGATPSEMLHALLLGMFKYCREMFFEQIGPTSKLADEINALAQKYGVQFGRQSGRDLPKCKFKHGIRKGKLQAKEFRGILLVMAAVLRSDMGVEYLKKNKNFDKDHLIKDWLMLVEMLLEWEAYLCEPEMKVGHVMRLQKKKRYIMYLLKKVGRRTAGMGLKLMKFHVIVHMAWDIILFGVPMEVDTGFNESHHKSTKVAARLTQKNESTFDYQTCTRLDEFFTIELAMEDIGGRRLSHYYRKIAAPAPKPSTKRPPIWTGGLRIWAYRNEETNKPCYSTGRSKNSTLSSVHWGANIVEFLVTLQEKLVTKKFLKGDELEIRGEHRRNGYIFRGHPQYRDSFWRDWALIDWGEETLPGQIWCFVVIDCIPTRPGRRKRDSVIEKKSGIFHGDIEVQNGVYAVVESSQYHTDPQKVDRSDIFIPIVKEVAEVKNQNRPWKRKYYLADVEAIHKPIVVVPNIGGKSKRDYFVVKQRSEWVEMFEAWVDDDHAHDVIGEDEPVPSHIVDNTY